MKNIINKLKSIKPKDILKITGIASLMCLGTFVGSLIYGILGAGFGLTLGYVCGKLITA
jgi:hypothetical protein